MPHTEETIEIIINEAFTFMARKAGVTVGEIMAFVASSDGGAKYFASLVAAAVSAKTA